MDTAAPEGAFKMTHVRCKLLVLIMCLISCLICEIKHLLRYSMLISVCVSMYLMCAYSHCADALSITMSIFSSGANTNKDLKKTQMLLIKNNFHSMEYMSAFLGIRGAMTGGFPRVCFCVCARA